MKRIRFALLLSLSSCTIAASLGDYAVENSGTTGTGAKLGSSSSSSGGAGGDAGGIDADASDGGYQFSCLFSGALTYCEAQTTDSPDASFASSCASNMGTLVDACPTANVVGCCKGPGSLYEGGAGETCYYTDVDPSIESGCFQNGGTWVSSP